MPLNLDQAKVAADGAMAEARKNSWHMAITIVGPDGELIYFVKMDDCQYASIGIAQHKAKAAATFRRSTVNFERLLGKGPYFSYLATLDGVIASRGGNPIVQNGKIICRPIDTVNVRPCHCRLFSVMPAPTTISALPTR